TYNATETRSYLQSIQLVGDCDSVGGIAEDGFSRDQAEQCAAIEHHPPTTYRYFGISQSSLNAAPRVVAVRGGYSPQAAPDFLAEFDGDGKADLVSGANGTTQYQCFQTQCQLDTSAELVNVATLGFYSFFGGQLYNCPCGPGTGTITGPSQGDGQHNFGPT